MVSSHHILYSVHWHLDDARRFCTAVRFFLMLLRSRPFLSCKLCFHNILWVQGAFMYPTSLSTMLWTCTDQSCTDAVMEEVDAGERRSQSRPSSGSVLRSEVTRPKHKLLNEKATTSAFRRSPIMSWDYSSSCSVLSAWPNLDRICACFLPKMVARSVDWWESLDKLSALTWNRIIWLRSKSNIRG